MKSPYIDTERFDVDGSRSPTSSDCQHTASTHVSNSGPQPTTLHMNISSERLLYLRVVARVAGVWGKNARRENNNKELAG